VTDVWVIRAGLCPYEEARQAQKALEEARHAGAIPDALVLLEHPPVYTKGRRSEPGHLPMGEDWYRMQGIEVCETDRGGQVTYHGPGQLVGYPIVDLRELPNRDLPERGAEEMSRIDVVDYVRRMEQVITGALDARGIAAECREGITGVWVDERKIGSIGVHVNRGITTHGFAVNVANDLQPFEWIVPCGIEGCRVTSLTRELGAEQDLQAFATTVVGHFGDGYDRVPVELSVADLVERVPGAAALAADLTAVR
jgi:lipoyl(octanoyl) transferase